MSFSRSRRSLSLSVARSRSCVRGFQRPRRDWQVSAREIRAQVSKWVDIWKMISEGETEGAWL